MNKNQKILLGVAGVAIVGYLYWKNKQTTPTAKMVGANGSLFAGTPNKPLFASASGMKYGNFKDTPCLCHTGSDIVNGTTIYKCGDGVHLSATSNGPCKQTK